MAVRIPVYLSYLYMDFIPFLSMDLLVFPHIHINWLHFMIFSFFQQLINGLKELTYLLIK